MNEEIKQIMSEMNDIKDQIYIKDDSKPMGFRRYISAIEVEKILIKHIKNSESKADS